MRNPIRERLAWPVESLLWSIEHDDSWLEAWGLDRLTVRSESGWFAL